MEVFVKPQDKTLVGTPKMNLLAKLLRNHDDYNKVVKEEGFELNPIGWIWEWSIYLKGTRSFLVLHEQENELFVFFYLKGTEYLKTPTFKIPVETTIGEMEADSFMKLLSGIQVRTIANISKSPKSTNYTKPKKRRK
jgi:hypothetical protein